MQLVDGDGLGNAIIIDANVEVVGGPWLELNVHELELEKRFASRGRATATNQGEAQNSDTKYAAHDNSSLASDRRH
jgi:predicted dinucleotide-utilizing enzyme